METICSAEAVVKSYGRGPVLSDVHHRIDGPGLHAIIGPSGSGKTTLLNLLAGLDTPDRGRVVLADQVVSEMRPSDRVRLRARHVGFVFQRFDLLPSLTVEQNVVVPITAAGCRPDRKWIAELSEHLGVDGLHDRYPGELSGGQQQRVAIVRALARRPSIVFADEPTGSLDRVAGEAVVGLLRELAASHGTPIVVVTHDDDLAASCTTVLAVRDGHVVRT